MENTEVEGLIKVLEPYVTDSETLDLLSRQLYEVLDGSQKFVQKYQMLFSLPSEDSARREALAEILMQIFVLLEDMMWHCGELHKEIDKATDEIDADDQEKTAEQPT